MLDIKFIRDNFETVSKAVKNKREHVDLNKLIELDKSKRHLQFRYDSLKAEQNQVSKEIAVLKKTKQDCNKILSNMKKLSEEIKQISSELGNISIELDRILLTVPNIPDRTVSIGADSSENRLVRIWGNPPVFDFTPSDHLSLSEGKLLDFPRAAKVAGNGFPVYKNHGALLERALINYMLDYHITNHGYNELWIPFLANRKAMTGTGQIPKLEADMYNLKEDDLFLIPTSEVPVTNFFSNETLDLSQLPANFVSYSPCFRREAGSYGKDTKGLQRLHQFNKVEMVRFVKPEDSEDALEEMVLNAEAILKNLGLHYRVMELCSGDMSFASAKTYDIEVWAPGANKYLEVSSVSNFRDFQARRSSIRFRDEDGKLKLVHTLNGSGLATPRTFIAIVETYQNKDGTVTLPPPLRPYCNNLEKI